MKERKILWALTCVLLVAMVMLPAVAQVNTGQITGTVRDSSGAVIPNATVTARNLGTQQQQTVHTGPQGQYTIPGLPPAQYTVSATAPNFAPYEARTEVTVGGHLTIDPVLNLAGATTTVTVEAEGGAAVNTQTQELSQIITPAQVEQLPSLTRNPYDFIAIAGNVSNGDATSPGLNSDQNTTSRGAGFAINGQRESGTEILLDGAENTDLFTATVGQRVPLDSVQEYRVVTSNFDAQYGRASGGVVNVATKSGTNALHGSIWEFNRLSAYTANTYANVVNGAEKGKYTRNQFGYAIGGPVIKDKLFFFQSTEWTRVRSNAVEQAYVLTPQFLALAAPNVRSFFNTFGANKFNFASALSADAVRSATGAALPGIPGSTPVVGLVNFTAPADAGGDVPQNTYDIVGRIDFNPTSKTQMFFRYALFSSPHFIGSDFASPYSQYNVGEASYDNSALFSLNHTFGSSFLSNTKLSFSRLNFKNTYDPKQQNVPDMLLDAAGGTVNNIFVQMPGLFAQFAGAGGLPFGGPQNVTQINEDLAWTKGSHNLKFGGQFNYQQINRAFGAYAQGLEQLGTSVGAGFDALTTGQLALFQAAIDPQGKFPCRTDATGLTSTAHLQITPACTLTLPVGQPSFARSFRYRDWAIYAQDSWKMTQRFTFNYGLRYEYYGVQHNDNPFLDSNFYYGPGANIFQQIRNGSVQIAPLSPVGGLWSPDYGGVAPRIGFAYDLTGDGKTSVRGGFGISYERNFGNVTFNVIQNPPNYASVQITPGGPVTNDNLGPFAGSGGTVPLKPSSLRHVAQNIKLAQTQFYSLAMERELARNTVLSLEYSGAHGVHLYDIAAFNPRGGGQVYLGDPFDGTHFTRPNNQYTGINTRGSHGTSRYNAMNVRLQSNDLRHTGLSVTANYTWSHSLDDLSSTFSDSTGGASNGIGNLGYLDPRNPKLDWGSSDFDVRHRVSLGMIWSTPWLKTGHGLEGQALGGWSIAPIFTARTGTPFSIFDTTNSLNAGAGNGIPRYVPTGAIPSFAVGTPVPAAPNDFTMLTLPAADETIFDPVLGISDFGPFPANMSRRNAFRGPGAWNFNLALSKTFKVTERVGLEFRAEGFDILNHHNYYINALNLDAANFAGGPITVSALKGGLGNLAIGGNHDERRFGQFALKVKF